MYPSTQNLDAGGPHLFKGLVHGLLLCEERQPLHWEVRGSAKPKTVARTDVGVGSDEVLQQRKFR